MSKGWVQRVLILTGLLVMWSTAFAEFRFIGKDARPEKIANAQPVASGGCPAGLRWSGTPMPFGAPQVTQATDMPMEVALRRLVPAGWSVVFDSPEIGKRPTTWRHTGPWQQAVDAVLRFGRACGTADAAAKRLTVSNPGSGGGYASAPPAMVAPLREVSGGDVSSPMTPGVSGGYEVRAGDTVRETLRRWGAPAGWSVIWDASRDYTIEVSHRFDMESDFPAAAQALLDSYWRQGKPVKASMYSNKVLRVEDAQQ